MAPRASFRGRVRTTQGPLFCPITRAGTLRVGRSLTGAAVRQLLRRRAFAAGVPAMSPHDLRRTYACDLLDAGADLPAVQQLLGHASPATTSRYERRGDRARRAAAERLRRELPIISVDAVPARRRPGGREPYQLMRIEQHSTTPLVTGMATGQLVALNVASLP